MEGTDGGLRLCCLQINNLMIKVAYPCWTSQNYRKIIRGLKCSNDITLAPTMFFSYFFYQKLSWSSVIFVVVLSIEYFHTNILKDITEIYRYIVFTYKFILNTFLVCVKRQTLNNNCTYLHTITLFRSENARKYNVSLVIPRTSTMRMHVVTLPLSLYGLPVNSTRGKVRYY